MSLPHADQLLHVAEVASLAPAMLALMIVGLPVLLSLAMYRTPSPARPARMRTDAE